MDDSTAAGWSGPTPEARLGGALRSAREAAEIRLREMARRTHRAHSSLVEYERGHRLATEEVVADYERVLEVPPGTLLAERERAKAERARIGPDGLLPPLAPVACGPGGDGTAATERPPIETAGAAPPATTPSEAPAAILRDGMGRRRPGRVLAALAGGLVIAGAIVMQAFGSGDGPRLRTGTAAGTRERVSIVLPPDKGVPRCWVFRGTAAVAPGRELLFGVKNLDNGDPNTYYSTVTDWPDGVGQGRWTHPLHFGSAADQEYAVSAMTVTEAAVEGVPNRTSASTWSAAVPPKGASVLTTIRVRQREVLGDC